MKKEKYGFIYLWFDRKHKRYYVGCRWGNINDGYVCSSNWMKQAYGHRPNDFKRRILKSNIPTRHETYIEEQRWLDMIKVEEIKPLNSKPRYYNLKIKTNETWHKYDENIKTIGQKISASKKGKSNGPCSPEKAKAISEAKKGKTFTEEHKQKLREARAKYVFTDERRKSHAKATAKRWVEAKLLNRTQL